MEFLPNTRSRWAISCSCRRWHPGSGEMCDVRKKPLTLLPAHSSRALPVPIRSRSLNIRKLAESKVFPRAACHPRADLGWKSRSWNFTTRPQSLQLLANLLGRRVSLTLCFQGWCSWLLACRSWGIWDTKQPTGMEQIQTLRLLSMLDPNWYDHQSRAGNDVTSRHRVLAASCESWTWQQSRSLKGRWGIHLPTYLKPKPSAKGTQVLLLLAGPQATGDASNY